MLARFRIRGGESSWTCRAMQVEGKEELRHVALSEIVALDIKFQDFPS